MNPHPTLRSLALATLGASLLGSLAAQTAAPSPKQDDIIELSPFQVDASRDMSWTATTTLIGTRTNQELSKVPITVDAITSEFMKDVQANTVEDAARFVSGLTVSPRFESRTDDFRITYRGLNSTTTSSRNFFLWYVPLDSYNIERYDFNKGSNSLIFGNSAPGGQTTAFTKQPRSYNFTEIFASYSTHGTYRVQGDFNQNIGKKLSLRLNVVDRSDKTYVEGNYQRLVAQDLAIAFRPFKTTTIRLEGEKGKFERRRADNSLSIRENAAPGRAFSTNNRWYYTSDGEIVQRTNTTPGSVDRSPAAGNVLSLLEGQSRSVLLPDGSRRSFSGFHKSFNVLGRGDYLDRPYDVLNATIEQSIGKLAMEFSYNQQHQDQERNDVSFGTTSSPPLIEVDSRGRPFVDLDGGTTYKIFGSRVKAGRFTAAYPFEFGQWMRQYFVFNASRERDYELSRRFSLVNSAATGSLANNVIRVRAYLDDPNVRSAAFWDRLTPANLPSTPTFQPSLNEVYSITGPLVDIRYSNSTNATLSGEYFNGRLLSLLGAGYNSIKRKIPVDSIYTPDARGLYAPVGSPETSPELYRYDKDYDLDAKTFLAGLTYVAINRPNLKLNVYGVYSQSFNWQSAQTFNGVNLGPITGDTYELGIKGDVFGQKLTYTLAFYQIQRENAAYSWTPDLLNITQLEELFNPNNLLPGDPGYFTVTSGLNNQRRTVNSQEKSRGFDFTLQAQRIKGVQARLTFSRTDVEATRDFTGFKDLLAAAVARTNAATAPGGNPAMAENAVYLANAQNILASNTNTTVITGLRSAPYSASWVLDYEPSQRLGLRLGANGAWVPDYNVAILNGIPYEQGGSHLVDFYAIYSRKILGYKTTFRLGIRNAFDLVNGENAFRETSALSTDAATGQPNYLYRYREPRIVSFSTTIRF